MQPITILGLALCLGVLYLLARKARKQPPSSLRQRFKTAHLLWGGLLVWFVIQINLQRLDQGLSGHPPTPPSTWERVIQTLSGWEH